MRRTLRLVGTLLILAGVLTLGWAGVVWQWQDPFTALYTHRAQSRLADELDRRMSAFGQGAARSQSLAATKVTLAADARKFRKTLGRGDPIGRLTIGAIGLDVVMVHGTDDETLKKGPGHYGPSGLPGQGRLVYVAGHRTTYMAPFSHIDALKPGEYVTVEMPYGTFKYVVTRHRIVEATDVSVLKSPNHEVLVLQACHPRFFASHRYLVYAKPVAVAPPGGPSYPLAGDRVAVGRR